MMRKTAIAISLIFSIVSLLYSQKNMILVETESFKKKGGWVVDQQFMDQMGSPFLPNMHVFSLERIGKFY